MGVSLGASLGAASGLRAQDPARSRHDVDTLLLELEARARWPWPAREDIAWLVSPGDVAPDGRSLVLAARMVDVRGDFAAPTLPQKALLAAATRLFEGATGSREDGSLELRLAARDGARAFTLRARVDASALAAAPADPIEAALVAGGYARAVGVRVRFDNLDALLADRAERRAYLAGPLCARWRELSLRRTRVDSAIGRDRWLASRGPAPVAPRIWHSRDAEIAGLGLASELEGRAREEAREAALARFLRGLRTPLPVAPLPWVAYVRGDDRVSRSGMGEHDAVDLGSLAHADGSFGGWPPGTPVRSPHRDARAARAPRDAARAWTVDTRVDGARLRLWLGAYHVDDAGLRSWNGQPGAPGWRSSDPAWRLLGLGKPCHVHLECLGAYEDPARDRLFVATRLLPALVRVGRAAPFRVAGRPQRLTRDEGARRSSRVLSAVALALPTLPGVERSGDEYRARRPLELGERFSLHTRRGAPRELRARLPHGAELALGPVTEALPPRLEPGPLRARLTLPSDALGPSVAPRTRKRLCQRLLRIVASIETR